MKKNIVGEYRRRLNMLFQCFLGPVKVSDGLPG